MKFGARLLRWLLLKPTLNLLSWILKSHANSLIGGGPLGWNWYATLAAMATDHHGDMTAFGGTHHAHSQLGGVTADQHHTQDHATRHQDGGADEISIAGLSGEPAELTTHKGLATGVHGVGSNYVCQAPASGHLVRTFTKGWTADKLLKGAGVDTNPVEIAVPFESRTSDPTPSAGVTWFRSDLKEFRGYLDVFGGVVRSASSPSTDPTGIGGDSSKIWHCDLTADKIYELLVSDFSVSRSASSPSVSPRDIGGDSSKIWHCDSYADKIYELLVSDFSVSRSASSPSTDPTGIGGDSSKIWHCDLTADKIYELLVSDFSVSRSASSPSTSPRGIGGDSSKIWHCDSDADKIYELLVSDFSVSRSASSPSTSPYGIGGDSSKIWHCDYTADKIYEIASGGAKTFTLT